MTVPPGYLPIFGTVSVASVLALVVLAMKFLQDAKRAIAENVRKDDEFVKFLKEREDTLIKSISEKYVSNSTYEDHHARLRNLETACPHCNPLKETKAVRRGDVA
jgi:hypothetical protein